MVRGKIHSAKLQRTLRLFSKQIFPQTILRSSEESLDLLPRLAINPFAAVPRALLDTDIEKLVTNANREDGDRLRGTTAGREVAAFTSATLETTSEVHYKTGSPYERDYSGGGGGGGEELGGGPLGSGGGVLDSCCRADATAIMLWLCRMFGGRDGGGTDVSMAPSGVMMTLPVGYIGYCRWYCE